MFVYCMCMDMKPFNDCHEAGDGDLFGRDEEGASRQRHGNVG
jgi:hypothetical protein